MIYLTKTLPDERPLIIETDAPSLTMMELLNEDSSHKLRLMIDREVAVLCENGHMTVTREGNGMIEGLVGKASKKVKKITKRRKVCAFITFS